MTTVSWAFLSYNSNKDKKLCQSEWPNSCFFWSKSMDALKHFGFRWHLNMLMLKNGYNICAHGSSPYPSCTYFIVPAIRTAHYFNYSSDKNQRTKTLNIGRIFTGRKINLGCTSPKIILLVWITNQYWNRLLRHIHIVRSALLEGGMSALTTLGNCYLATF